MRIIGLGGRMRSGKDTVARILGRWGYQRVAFADELKAEVYNNLLNLPPRPRADKIEWINQRKQELRWLLQFYGTDFRRRQDPDYWIKKLESRLDPDGSYAIADVRFPNEVEFVRRLGGTVWYIDRLARNSGPDPLGEHPSEQLDPSACDRVIDNNGSLEDLARRIELALMDSETQERSVSV